VELAALPVVHLYAHENVGFRPRHDCLKGPLQLESVVGVAFGGGEAEGMAQRIAPAATRTSADSRRDLRSAKLAASVVGAELGAAAGLVILGGHLFAPVVATGIGAVVGPLALAVWQRRCRRSAQQPLQALEAIRMEVDRLRSQATDASR
jgi:hypothetical protein